MENDVKIINAQKSTMVPILPLRDVVIYPYMVIPLFVGREKSIKALEVATDENKEILLITQKNSKDDDPTPSSLYITGTLANILQLLKLPDGTVKVLIEGKYRAKIAYLDTDKDYFVAEIAACSEHLPNARESDVLMRTLLEQFEKYVKLNRKIPPEVIVSLSGIDSITRMVDTVAAHLILKLKDKQSLLETNSVNDRIEKLMAFLEVEIDIQKIEKRIRGRVKKQMEKSQREYYLNEQIKAVQRELGEFDDTANEIDELGERIFKARMSSEAHNKANSELRKLRMIPMMSAEATVVRNYIEALLDVPWKKRSRITINLSHALKILDQDHFGLEKVKERIIEYLAVQKRVKRLRGPILCLVGPPGVGKTSVAQSIARATNRKYTRMALGGVHDEAEIRGHRRTYIGSMPGRIIGNLTKVGVRNPLFLLDEIDKMAQDFRGDPAAALLEVLDPEQNSTFSDHYLEVEYDLSDVMFVCTANTLNIPDALRDRMEIMRLAGYTENEKLNIAEQYLLPRAIEDNGLKNSEVRIKPTAILEIVRRYTRETGVRNLQREISKICRKLVTQIIKQNTIDKLVVSDENIENYLGVYKYQYGVKEEHDQVGQVTGLAWTEVGGELLTIESVVIPGKGKANYTGKLGNVMQESIKAATTVVRSRSSDWGIPHNFIQEHDIHIHVPEGSTPKDGPSAGIGMCIALVSAITGIAVKSNVAMTGEITLRGEILAIGGLKEKLLAAHRGGIDTVLIPRENVKDLKEIPKDIKQGLKIISVRWITEVLEVALISMPTFDNNKNIIRTDQTNYHEATSQNRH